VAQLGEVLQVWDNSVMGLTIYNVYFLLSLQCVLTKCGAAGGGAAGAEWLFCWWWLVIYIIHIDFELQALYEWIFKPAY
jgi:hypothetical protein